MINVEMKLLYGINVRIKNRVEMCIFYKACFVSHQKVGKPTRCGSHFRIFFLVQDSERTIASTEINFKSAKNS